MRNVDFSSWQGLLSTLLGLAIITLIGVGIRLLLMQTVQQRRERENRQINERLRTLIAAYKTLGGSFTGNLLVDPTHLREARMQDAQAMQNAQAAQAAANTALLQRPNSERARRIRDAVEGALSDILLLGTEEQVRLATKAATDLVAGRSVDTAALVVSLRAFIREVLNLEAVPAGLVIPNQGPTRPSGGASRGGGQGAGQGGAREAAGGGKGGGGNADGGGGGGGLGLGLALPVHRDDPEHQP